VLGYGTREGGRMLDFDGFGDEYSTPRYILDYSQSPPVDAISVIDETELRLIAQQLGVDYVRGTGTGDISSIVDGIDVGELRVRAGSPGSDTELYWIPAIPLGILLLAELVALSGAVAELRPRRQARS
jgi:Ca-activated chloride channel family protein